jgi:GrpB-like predicted nucleotidyltransferase (UPF0157 family)
MCLTSTAYLKGTTMIEIVDYKPTWTTEFLEIASKIRAALGDRALAIHHIGSTSVPNLAAKNVIDIQVTVAELDEQLLKTTLERAGFVWREGLIHDHCPPGIQVPNSELEKHFVDLEADGIRRANVHIRTEGRFNQRYALLCRDYLRSHPMARDAYAQIKRQLARYFPENTDAYYDIKDPVFDVIMAGANDWAAFTGWQPAPSNV